MILGTDDVPTPWGKSCATLVWGPTCTPRHHGPPIDTFRCISARIRYVNPLAKSHPAGRWEGPTQTLGIAFTPNRYRALHHARILVRKRCVHPFRGGRGELRAWVTTLFSRRRHLVDRRGKAGMRRPRGGVIKSLAVIVSFGALVAFTHPIVQIRIRFPMTLATKNSAGLTHPRNREIIAVRQLTRLLLAL